MKKKRTNNITFGLFSSKNIIQNIKDVPIYFKRLWFLLNYGYSSVAQWETYQWFIHVMQEIFINYKYHREGDIPFENCPEEKWSEKNNELYEVLLSYLDKMDEEKYSYSMWTKEKQDRIKVKNKFFQVFAEYFYDFWD